MHPFHCVFVLAAVVVVATCYQDDNQEHVREVRHSQQYNYGRDIVLPTWKPTYHHIGGSPTYRVRRQSSVSVGADHTRHQGSNINVDAQHRLWTGNNGRSQLDAHGNYNQHFGGPGRSRDYGAGVRFEHRF